MNGAAVEIFECFGGRCTVRVTDRDASGVDRAARQAQLTLLGAHRLLSRFDPDSELSRLNRDPRRAVPAWSTRRWSVRSRRPDTPSRATSTAATSAGRLHRPIRPRRTRGPTGAR
jgi:hypothetical protein